MGCEMEKRVRVQTAINEAARFIDRANDYLNDAHGKYGYRDSAAMKRASLDLTMAIRDLRRGG